MGIGNNLADRYEVRKMLGQGGMGVVYWAYDTLIRRHVALKTIRDVPAQAAVELFQEECNILASIGHPNIIEIFDVGKFADGEGAEKLYFVMPLLRGATLDTVLRGSTRPMPVERIVEILCQTCGGLHAAHEHGLVHRDLKPSNIFVLEDDSVKIIDFGVAHMVGALTASTPKGTLFYMSPEQVELKPATALSDIFSLAVVAYEALTLRHPFATQLDIADAILRHVPPLASELNAEVSPLVARVVHKTMAKHPRNRFSTARDLADALRKTSRGEPIESFDATRIQPRLDRATKALESGDSQFASEILTELESEGYSAPAMAPLRLRIDETIRQSMLVQLLESAKTRMNDEEYPLALQKIQEALEIDPANAEAIRMKANIESNGGNREVDGSLLLARQYLDKRAFSHARKTVEEVLQRQPSDPQAREMMNEIQRREQQYAQVRQGKEKLYRAATEAHANGELTLAAARLEAMLELDKSAPEISHADRSIAFWRFYDQVHSEYDAIIAACAEARHCLAEGNFNRAVEIGAAALKKYPAEPATQALSSDIESRKRQDFSALIENVNRMVENEPDLDRRIEILSRAAGQYPDEPHFQQTLKLTREQSELARSIVAKAMEHEEQSQFGEALDQLEILRTVHKQYPGLEFEIARISKRRSQQKRKDNKVRWAQQLEYGEEAPPLGLLFELQHEAPRQNEAVAAKQSHPATSVAEHESDTAARQNDGLQAGAHALQTRARELYDEGNFEEAAAHLRLALELDQSDMDVRGALVDTLVQHARSLPESERDHASELIASALALDPANSQASGMAVLTGNPMSVEQAVTEHVAAEPVILDATIVEPVVQEHAIPEPAFPDHVAEDFAEPVTADLEAVAPAEVPAVAFAASATDAGTSPTTPADSAQSQTINWPRWLGYGGVAAVLAALVIALLFRHAMKPARHDQAPQQAQAPAALFPVDVRTVPDGATIMVNDKVSGTSNLHLQLPAGTYRINVAMDGYQAQQTSVTVSADHAAAADVVLRPTPTTLRLLTDFSAASVTLDGRRQNNVQSGQLILDGVPGGSHVLGIRSGASRATFHFSTRERGLPGVTNIEIGKAANAILIASLGYRIRIYSSQKPGDVTVDGKSAGSLNRLGVELPDVGPGDHEIDIVQDNDHRKVIYQTASAPALTIYLNNQAPEKQAHGGNGSLLVITGEDNVRVSVDGKPQRPATRHGQMLISNLSEKEHVVSVSKVGFGSTPEQHVTIKRGQEGKLAFELHPASNVALLHLAKAMPGIQVLVDGKLSGTVDQDGNFPAVQVAPGSHRVQLRKDEYKPKVFQLSFAGGQDSTLSASDVVIDATFGFLKVSANPATARITVQRPGETPHPLTGSSQRLPEGHYTVSATAPHFLTQTTNVEIIGGSTKNLNVQLSPETEHAAAAAPNAASVGMSGWQPSAGWHFEGDHFTRRGGNLTLFKPQGSGTYTFSASVKHGKQLKWVAHVVDQKNYVEFELDSEYFYRRQTIDGKSKELIRKKHGLEMPPSVGATVRMTVGPAGITQRIKMPEGWTVLDWWQRPYLSEGSVGFLIPGKDEVQLSGFSFIGNE